MKSLRELFSLPLKKSISWTPVERQAFLLFSKSTTGIKFLEFLRQYASGVTYDAVRQDRVAQNAYARGVQDTVHLIINLAYSPDREQAGMSFDEDLEPLPSLNSGPGRNAPFGGHSAI